MSPATTDIPRSQVSAAVANLAIKIRDLDENYNFYSYNPNFGGNDLFHTIYMLIFWYTVGMLYYSRYWWYNVTFICGFALEGIGYLGRVLSHNKGDVLSYYIMQSICLTIAPAFIMAGIYFLFGQLVVIHGRQYSFLKPMWYSYFFIGSDIFSLLVQSSGGSLASTASSGGGSAQMGINITVAGIVLQVIAMTVFLGFWFEFLNRVYFKHAESYDYSQQGYKVPMTKSFGNFMKFLFNTKSVRQYRHEHLEQFYNKKFASIRQRKLFDWMPLAMTISVVAIYIRCIYRVVELAMGLDGYLNTHEPYILVLDATMVTICGIIFVPFHPVWVFGKKNIVKLATIKKNLDESDEEMGSHHELDTVYREYFTQEWEMDSNQDIGMRDEQIHRNAL